MTDSAVKKELPVGTIVELTPGQIVLKLEMGDTETTATYKTTPKVDEFLSNPKYVKNYHKGACVEFSAHNGVVSLVRPAKTFQKASAQPTTKTQPEPSVKVVPMETVTQSASTFVSPQAQPSAQIQKLAVSSEAVNVKEIGSFDPAKIKGYEITDTCQVTQFEPITIKVICDTPEDGRKALIDAWSVFGQYTPVTKDIVYNHIKSHLLRDTRS